MHNPVLAKLAANLDESDLKAMLQRGNFLSIYRTLPLQDVVAVASIAQMIWEDRDEIDKIDFLKERAFLKLKPGEPSSDDDGQDEH